VSQSPGNAGAEPPESPSESRESPSEPSESPSNGEPSHASRTASSAARVGPFLEDPGPEFRAEDGGAAAPETPEAGPAELHALPEAMWEQESVSSILNAQGTALHAVAGVGQSDWVYTEADLMAIAPPLTRILNRYPATRAAAGTGDELAVAIGLGGYVSRSYRERKAVLDFLASQAEEAPATGRAAEPGTGPPPAPEDNNGEGPTWRTE
jgi:hypothetical protein